MKISEHLGDALAFLWDRGVLLFLGAVSAAVLFRHLPADDADDPVADDYDPGAAWDRAYDRAVDESNGVV